MLTPPPPATSPPASFRRRSSCLKKDIKFNEELFFLCDVLPDAPGWSGDAASQNLDATLRRQADDDEQGLTRPGNATTLAPSPQRPQGLALLHREQQIPPSCPSPRFQGPFATSSHSNDVVPPPALLPALPSHNWPPAAPSSSASRTIPVQGLQGSQAQPAHAPSPAVDSGPSTVAPPCRVRPSTSKLLHPSKSRLKRSMDRTTPVPAPVPAPAATGVDLAALAPQYTHQFRQMLSNRRMNKLEAAARLPREPSPDATNPQPPTARPSARPAIRNIPMMPAPPRDDRSQRMRAWMQSLSEMPVRWTYNPAALDRVLEQIPLQSLHAQAAERYQILRAQAASLGREPDWEEADCLMLVLMRWFKSSFMTWIDNPPCERCYSPSVALGGTPPTPEETAWDATTVEIYRCSNEACRNYVRFPRYTSPIKLMETRRGRGGEWVNCFGFICRAVNQRVRWVWCAEDLVWLEYYSFFQKRWIHVDVCEGVFDKPQLYTEVWGKKLSYCIAFSDENAVDVTRRYVRRPWKTGKARRRCPENVLLFILQEIRTTRRARILHYSKQHLDTFIKEDRREENELRGYIVKAAGEDICSLRVEDILRGHTAPRPRSSDTKVPSRATESTEASPSTSETDTQDPRQPPSR